MSRPPAPPPAAIAALMAVALTGAACTTGDMADYPTLERRAVERQGTVPPAPPPALIPAPVTATLAEAIRGLARDADTGEAAFRTALANGRATVERGRGSAVGSEAWAMAQLTLSRIDTARAATTLALAELDRLVIDAAANGDSSGAGALAVEQARVTALVAGQQRVIDALQAGLQA